MKPIKLLVLVVALPLVLASCAHKDDFSSSAASTPGSYLSANDPWQKLLRCGPDKQLLSKDRLEALGDIALEYQDYQASLVNFLQILKKEPKRYDLHYKVGVLFLLCGQLPAAQEELALVLAHSPDMVRAHEALGLVFLQEKRYPDAEQEFRTAIDQDPGRASSHHLLGVAYLETGQTSRGIDELKRAVALNRHMTGSYILMAQAYNMLKQYPQAVACAKDGLVLAPNNKRLNLQLGNALAEQKRYSEAMNAYMKAGDEAQAYNNIGVHYFMAGQYEDAAKCFQQALELRPTFYQEAKTNLQKALEKLQESHNGKS
jgi:tetratricopeptide (TPR) repeat protein